MGSCPGPSLGHCWSCQLASPRLGSLHHALSVAPRHQGCSVSRLSRHPASTHPTAVQSRLWAMPEPLTAALTRGSGTWPHISPEVLSPFPAGDVSQTLFFSFLEHLQVLLSFLDPEPKHYSHAGESPGDLPGLQTSFLITCQGRMCALVTLLGLWLLPVFAQLQIMCRAVHLY